MFIGVLLLAALVFYMIYIAIRIVFEGIRQASPGCLVVIAIISIVILVSMASIKSQVFIEIGKIGELNKSIFGNFGFLIAITQKILPIR
jgi:hypothetical protein